MSGGRGPIVIDARSATARFPGIGRYVSELSRSLQTVSHSRDIRLLVNPCEADRLPLPDLPVIGCDSLPFSLAQHVGVPRLLKNHRAALYHSTHPMMPVARGLPTVVTIYDLIPLLFPQYFSGWQRLVLRLAFHRAVCGAQRIIAISEATRNDMIDRLGAGSSRITVIPLAAASNFHPYPESRLGSFRKEHGLGRYCLYAGSNKPHKNLPALIDAWKAAGLDRSSPDLHLVIAGPWDARYPQAKKAVESAGLTGRVSFLGSVPEGDLPLYYAGAEWFVFPSLSEGFGLPVLEAMACGAPVLCSNVPGLAELAGDCAMMFDPRDVRSIAAALGESVSHPAARGQWRDHVLDRVADFSWERTAAATLAVYDDALKASR